MAGEATSHQDQMERHGKPDPSKWDKAENVTGRPADVAPPNSTMAERAAARVGGAKQVDADEVENKAVTSAAKKAPAAKKAAAK